MAMAMAMAMTMKPLNTLQFPNQDGALACFLFESCC